MSSIRLAAKRLLAATVLLIGATAVAGVDEAAAAPTASFVVVLNTGVPISMATKPLGIRPALTFTHALTGFSAQLTSVQVTALKRLKVVIAVVPDVSITIPVAPPAPAPTGPSQVIPTQTRYVHADVSPTAKIDGTDQRVNADIAVLDSGIDATAPDLNLVGGISCIPGQSPFRDEVGHGTAVAGVAAALDNGIGVVGIAPGARLWSVRITTKADTISLASALCGLDWVAANHRTVSVVNASWGFALGAPDDSCIGTVHSLSLDSLDPLHAATCAVNRLGVPIVASAGNDTADASLTAPASFDEVIAVSALTDYDGQPGALAPATCAGHDATSILGEDDHFATYSNFGPAIDFIAPGSCDYTIDSNQMTEAPGGYGYWYGTSFAAPVVAGSVALYKAHHPNATPAQVKTALTAAALTRAYPGDPDGIAEPTVDAAGF